MFVLVIRFFFFFFFRMAIHQVLIVVKVIIGFIFTHRFHFDRGEWLVLFFPSRSILHRLFQWIRTQRIIQLFRFIQLFDWIHLIHWTHWIHWIRLACFILHLFDHPLQILKFLPIQNPVMSAVNRQHANILYSSPPFHVSTWNHAILAGTTLLHTLPLWRNGETSLTNAINSPNSREAQSWKLGISKISPLFRIKTKPRVYNRSQSIPRERNVVTRCRQVWK